VNQRCSSSPERCSDGTDVRVSNQAATAHAAAATASVSSFVVRVAVISDIHGNLHALEAVLADIVRETPDALWCLGDVVGYGARPNECCTLTREQADLCLCGNHDLAVLGELDIADFSDDAAEAARWTRGILAEEHADWLSGLEPRAEQPGVQLFHASPRDPVWDYVLSDEVALLSLQLTTAPVVLVGHSHIALAVSLADGSLGGGLAPGGAEADLAAGRWLLNPGSVGQPRDGDARAAWLLLDSSTRRADFRRVPYAVERSQAEIREQGLPETLAARLAHGV
jgi:diadenosine tetraphosphatase ApaH/serine/threonine PP2A family protein phosphatase